MPNFTCDVEDCNGIPKTGLHCEMHRRRNTVYGTPTPIKICFECKKEFVWIDKCYSFSPFKTHVAKAVTCRECVTFFNEFAEYLPRNRQGVRNHGLSIRDYVNLLVLQDFLCALCKKDPEHYNRLSIDHDHLCCPGAHGCKDCVRGLICLGCNALLGHLETKANLIAEYEKSYKYNRPFKEGQNGT